MKQRTEEWYQARLGQVGASMISEVMAKGEGKTRNSLMTRLLAENLSGKPVETYKSAAMEYGIEAEAQARLAYEMETGNIVDEVGWIPHRDIVGTGCSPDGLVNNDGLVEIKCPLITTHIDFLRNGKIDRKYMLQMQWQMEVTGRSWCDFVSYCPDIRDDAKKIKIMRVTRTQSTIIEIADEVKRFIDDMTAELEKLA